MDLEQFEPAPVDAIARGGNPIALISERNEFLAHAKALKAKVEAKDQQFRELKSFIRGRIENLPNEYRWSYEGQFETLLEKLSIREQALTQSTEGG